MNASYCKAPSARKTLFTLLFDSPLWKTTFSDTLSKLKQKIACGGSDVGCSCPAGSDVIDLSKWRSILPKQPPPPPNRKFRNLVFRTEIDLREKQAGRVTRNVKCTACALTGSAYLLGLGTVKFPNFQSQKTQNYFKFCSKTTVVGCLDKINVSVQFLITPPPPPC